MCEVTGGSDRHAAEFTERLHKAEQARIDNRLIDQLRRAAAGGDPEALRLFVGLRTAMAEERKAGAAERKAGALERVVRIQETEEDSKERIRQKKK